MAQVRANLMCAPGGNHHVQLGKHKPRRRSRAQRLIARFNGQRAGKRVVHHPRTRVLRVLQKIRLQRLALLGKPAQRQRAVMLLDAVPGERGAQRFLALIRLCRQHHAARAGIQPVNRTRGCAMSNKPRLHGVLADSILIHVRRKPDGLQKRNQTLVLIQHVQLRGFQLRGQIHLHPVAPAHRRVRQHPRAVHLHVLL